MSKALSGAERRANQAAKLLRDTAKAEREKRAFWKDTFRNDYSVRYVNKEGKHWTILCRDRQDAEFEAGRVIKEGATMVEIQPVSTRSKA